MTAKTNFTKKTNKYVKEELLSSLREHDEDEETEVKTAKYPTEAIELINHYKGIARTQHKQVIQYLY